MMIRRLTTLALLLCLMALPAGAEKTNESANAAFTGHVLEPQKAKLPDVSILNAPDGFRVTVFANDLINPRMLAVSDSGAVYVTRRSVGDVVMLVDVDRDGVADEQKVVANRPQMHGIAIDGRDVYLATVKDVYRATILSDGTFSELTRIIDDLPDSGQHPNRTLSVGPDKMLYISVGSTCNACTESSPESATILQASSDGKRRKIFASGLRNTIGFAWHPATGELIGMDHNIDWHGDDQPKEEVNVIEQGKNYGWPYILADGLLNPQDDPPGDISFEQLAANTTKPALTYAAHSAPMQMAVYSGRAFPADYRGDAFVAMRGSWNRKPPSGYEVARIKFENGRPTSITPFLTGFLQHANGRYKQFGRLAGVAVANDGSLLISDDENGVIYRVAYDGPVDAENLLSSIRPEVRKSSATSPGLAVDEVAANGIPRLEVSSGAFADGAPIPLAYTDYGQKISPPLQWSAGPKGTRSYAIIVDDPDAKPDIVNHWTLYNVPSKFTHLPEGLPGVPSLALPKDADQGATTRGSVGYFGPRPPPADDAHRYHFQVFALDAVLDLPPSVDKAALLQAMKGHVLAAGVLIGTFDRSEDVQKTVDAAKDRKD